MRIGRVCVLLSITCLMIIAVAGVGWAHVVLHPDEAPAGSYQKFDVSVPTEKDIPTTSVQVEVPEGFTVTGVKPVPGWQSAFEKDGGVVKSITWSGGQINPEEFQEFSFQARTPVETGEYSWRAFQTYKDGSVVEWSGEPDSEEPASVVEIVSGSAEEEADEHGAENQGGEQQGSEQQSSEFTPFAAYGGLALGAVALVVASVALFGMLRKG